MVEHDRGEVEVAIPGKPGQMSGTVRLVESGPTPRDRRHGGAASASRWSAARSRPSSPTCCARRSTPRTPSAATTSPASGESDAPLSCVSCCGQLRVVTLRVACRAEPASSPQLGAHERDSTHHEAHSAHVGVAVVGRGDEGLLDRAGRGPAHQVGRGAGLVVGAGRPRPAERLLADDRAGRLVVDVEVAGGEPQRVRGQRDRARGPGR